MTINEAHRAPVYGPIHKLHRHALATTITRLGATDFSNAREALAAVELVRDQIAFGREHLRNEDRHVHPHLRAIGGEPTAALIADHEDHEKAFQALEALAKRVEGAPAAERVAAGAELYLAFVRFAATDFLHMDFEERVVEPLIHKHYTDAEIERMHAPIIAETSAAEMQRLAELAARALSKPELDAVAAMFEAAGAAKAA